MADETNAGGLASVILAASPGTPTLTCRKIADAVLTYMAEREAAAREQGRAEAGDAIRQFTRDEADERRRQIEQARAEGRAEAEAELAADRLTTDTP